MSDYDGPGADWDSDAMHHTSYSVQDSIEYGEWVPRQLFPAVMPLPAETETPSTPPNF